jgi:hypothetical protein
MSLIAIPAVTAGRRARLDPLAWLAAGKITVACLLGSSFLIPADPGRGGSGSHIGIELTEWPAFTHPVATSYGAYRETVGDLGMDMAGAALGAITLWSTGRAATAFDR